MIIDDNATTPRSLVNLLSSNDSRNFKMRRRNILRIYECLVHEKTFKGFISLIQQSLPEGKKYTNILHLLHVS